MDKSRGKARKERYISRVNSQNIQVYPVFRFLPVRLFYDCVVVFMLVKVIVRDSGDENDGGEFIGDLVVMVTVVVVLLDVVVDGLAIWDCL